MKCLLFANTDWYLFNFCLPLAETLQREGHEVLLVSPPGAYGAKMREKGIRWIAAPMERKSLNPLRELSLLAWLWQLMRREQPDIVHSFTIKAVVYGGLISRLVGAGRVNSVSGMGYVFISDEPKARVLRPVVRLLLGLALGGERSRLIVQNTDDVRFAKSHGVARPDQIRLLRGAGVNSTRFSPSSEKEPSAARQPLRVLLAARMLWDKGVAEFVEAARLLRAENRALRFQLAGSPDPGNPAAIPESALAEWQAAGLVELLGHVVDMPALIRAVDIVVLPSYREGLPQSLTEAAACAKPIVTTDVPGCREVVTDGVDGLMVPVRDALSLARAIARLQDDPSLAARLGLAARAKALAQFDERVIIGQTLDVYADVAADQRDRERQPQRVI
jgi:glycosyltransferase involved in cell wall biosynthesis